MRNRAHNRIGFSLVELMLAGFVVSLIIFAGVELKNKLTQTSIRGDAASELLSLTAEIQAVLTSPTALQSTFNHPDNAQLRDCVGSNAAALTLCPFDPTTPIDLPITLVDGTGAVWSGLTGKVFVDERRLGNHVCPIGPNKDCPTSITATFRPICESTAKCKFVDAFSVTVVVKNELTGADRARQGGDFAARTLRAVVPASSFAVNLMCPSDFAIVGVTESGRPVCAPLIVNMSCPPIAGCVMTGIDALGAPVCKRQRMLGGVLLSANCMQGYP